MADIILATINAKWIHPSLALRLLKANLRELEDKCEILEFALRQPLSEKIEPILAGQPRILGLSVSIWNHKATYELLKALEKEWGRNAPCAEASINRPIIVLGGPEVSRLPEGAEIFSHADYVIRGEGEESFPALCREILSGQAGSTRVAAGKSPGQAGKAGDTGAAADGGPRSAVFIQHGETAVDLNNINPAYHFYTDEDLKKKHIYVEASRGCPFGCEYCQGGLQGPREFPLEPFLEDMAKLIDRGGRTFKFLDRSFNLNMGRAIKIMEFFLDRLEAGETAVDRDGNDSPGKKLPRARPLCVHFEMIPYRFPKELKEVLCRFPPGSLRLEIGIQTLNPHTAKLIQRAGKIEEALKNLQFLRSKTNAILHVDLIAGLPGEDLASFGAGFDRLWKTLSVNQSRPGTKDNLCEIQVGILKGLPGTPILRHNESHGMIYSGEPPYELMETGVLPAPELGKLKNFARFWELIVNRNSFPDFTARFLPPGEAAFDKFMNLSDEALEHFGRNWGLDRKELRAFLGSALIQ